jgi:hypothetical protein
MRGLPDSAVYGTYKRMSRSRGGKVETNELAFLYDIFMALGKIVPSFSSRKYEKARAEFYAKHGYYMDDSTR